MKTFKTTGAEWIIRPCGEKLEIWLCGGCIDSVEELDKAEKFFKLMRPLMVEREEMLAAKSVPVSVMGGDE